MGWLGAGGNGVTAREEWRDGKGGEKVLTPSQLLASVLPPQRVPQLLCCAVHHESGVRSSVECECEQDRPS